MVWALTATPGLLINGQNSPGHNGECMTRGLQKLTDLFDHQVCLSLIWKACSHQPLKLQCLDQPITVHSVSLFERLKNFNYPKDCLLKIDIIFFFFFLQEKLGLRWSPIPTYYICHSLWSTLLYSALLCSTPHTNPAGLLCSTISWAAPVNSQSIQLSARSIQSTQLTWWSVERYF